MRWLLTEYTNERRAAITGKTIFLPCSASRTVPSCHCLGTVRTQQTQSKAERRCWVHSDIVWTSRRVQPWSSALSATMPPALLEPLTFKTKDS